MPHQKTSSAVANEQLRATSEGTAASLFLERSRYYLRTEYWTKLRIAVEALPADVLWSRPNEQSNSVGNLLLHLAGNVRQWIVCGVGGAPGSRNRDAEFAARSGPPAADLLADLERVLDEARSSARPSFVARPGGAARDSRQRHDGDRGCLSCRGAFRPAPGADRACGQTPRAGRDKVLR